MKNSQNDFIEPSLIRSRLSELEDKIAQTELKLRTLENKINARFTELSTPKPHASRRIRADVTGPMFVPEVDFLIQTALRRNDFRRGKYNVSDGRASMGSKPSDSKMIYGHYIEGVNCIDVLVPYPSLKRDLEDTYGVSHRHDYRANKHRTAYMDGVLSGIGDKKIRGTTAAQVLAWDRKLTPEIIQRTREYWENIAPDEEALRICDKETMFKVLDLLSENRLVAGIIPWVVDIERFSMNPDINPKKIKLDEDAGWYGSDAKGQEAMENQERLSPTKANQTNEDESIDIEDDVDWDALD